MSSKIGSCQFMHVNMCVSVCFKRHEHTSKTYPVLVLDLEICLPQIKWQGIPMYPRVSDCLVKTIFVIAAIHNSWQRKVNCSQHCSTLSLTAITAARVLTLDVSCQLSEFQLHLALFLFRNLSHLGLYRLYGCNAIHNVYIETMTCLWKGQ